MLTKAEIIHKVKSKNQEVYFSKVAKQKLNRVQCKAKNKLVKRNDRQDTGGHRKRAGN